MAEGRPRAGRLSIAVVAEAARHLARELGRSRLLLAYCLLGLLTGLVAGPAGLGQAAANYALLGLYVLVIYVWTRGEPTLAAAAPAAGASRRRDLALVTLLFALTLGFTGWFWLGEAPRAGLRAIRDWLLAAGWAAMAGTAANAAVVSAGVLLPALLAILALGYRPRDVGLAPRRLDLGLALVLLGVVLAGAVRLAGGRSTPLFESLAGVPLALALFAGQVFVNGLQEELIFRGALLSRLARWLPSPRHALVATSVLFVVGHVPSLLVRATGVPWWAIVFGALVSPGPQPTGLAWGYLCYRTRSIWPGVLWHTSFTTLGILFL